MKEERKRELLTYLVARLKREHFERGGYTAGRLGDLLMRADAPHASTQDLWLAFRGLVNVREPWPTDEVLLSVQDELLQGMIAEAGITQVADAQPAPEFGGIPAGCIRLWRGDITTLAVDAIVNAANSGMTGCWAPLHYCIDNAIHTFAGMQLRIECARLIREQGHPEPTGQAKVTPAYNLPSRHVIHTVGPIAEGHPTPEHCAQLASSYRACLDAALAAGDTSIALCCISTGVFGFPQDQAAPIAIGTVRAWLNAHAQDDMTVVFNVFSAEDEAIYRRLLGMENESEIVSGADAGNEASHAR